MFSGRKRSSSSAWRRRFSSSSACRSVAAAWRLRTSLAIMLAMMVSRRTSSASSAEASKTRSADNAPTTWLPMAMGTQMKLISSLLTCLPPVQAVQEHRLLRDLRHDGGLAGLHHPAGDALAHAVAHARQLRARRGCGPPRSAAPCGRARPARSSRGSCPARGAARPAPPPASRAGAGRRPGSADAIERIQFLVVAVASGGNEGLRFSHACLRCLRAGRLYSNDTIVLNQNYHNKVVITRNNPRILDQFFSTFLQACFAGNVRSARGIKGSWPLDPALLDASACLNFAKQQVCVSGKYKNINV